MQIRVMILLVFTLAIAIFAVLNTQPVTINFLFLKAEIELIFVILFSILAGSLFMFVLSSMKQLQLTKKIKSYEKEIIMLKEEIAKIQQSTINDKAVSETTSITEKQTE